jgi:hypothetical protein
VSGDVVEYVICEDGNATAPTQRAYHPSEIKDKPGTFILPSLCFSINLVLASKNKRYNLKFE